jgi:DNA sulfur modification protein DndD
MWISRIELTNFKGYVREVLEFPPPDGEKNIILIGGLNGYGKT